MNIVLLTEELARLAGAMAHHDDVIRVLDKLCKRFTDLIGIAGIGVSLIDSGRLHLATAADATLEDLAMVQHEDGRGPSFEAVQSLDPVTADRLGEHADRWPAYVRHAETIGVQAVASVPMATHDIAGTLDLYERRPHVWSRDELAIAALLAVMAGTFLSNVTALERAQGEIAQLQIALDSRVLIEQAKGIIAATHSISIDRAFERLRKHARDHKAPLHTVAAAVVNLGLRP